METSLPACQPSIDQTATRYHSPSVSQQSIFSRDRLLCNYGLTSWSQAPAARTKGFVEYTSVLDFREIDDAIRFDLNIIRTQRSHKDVGRFLGEWLDRETMK